MSSLTGCTADDYPTVNGLLSEQLQGRNPAKIRIASRGSSLQLRFSSPDLLLGSPVSVSVNGCATTLAELQTLLYTTEEQKKSVGCWIHGRECLATILKCESSVTENHTTTGRGVGTNRSEMHYTGPCLLAFIWNYQGAKAPITVVASTSYAKFMWDPRARALVSRGPD